MNTLRGGALGQGAAANRAAKAHLVKTVAAGTQTIDRVAQAVAKGQLAESHAQELIPAGKAAETLLTVKAVDASMKDFQMNQAHQLSEDRAADVHSPIVHPGLPVPKIVSSSSNRTHPFEAVIC